MKLYKKLINKNTNREIKDKKYKLTIEKGAYATFYSVYNGFGMFYKDDVELYVEEWVDGYLSATLGTSSMSAYFYSETIINTRYNQIKYNNNKVILAHDYLKSNYLDVNPMDIGIGVKIPLCDELINIIERDLK